MVRLARNYGTWPQNGEFVSLKEGQMRVQARSERTWTLRVWPTLERAGHSPAVACYPGHRWARPRQDSISYDSEE